MPTVKKFVLVLSICMVLIFIYLSAWPTPIDPVSWQPPPAPPLSGSYALNQDLAAVTRFEVPGGYGPEDVDVDADGRVYVGLLDGRIMRHHQGQWETFAQTGGRPLGLHFDAAGRLIVADAYKGLLAVNTDGQIEVLTNQVEGAPIVFADDVDIAADGVIYFSDASTRFDFHHHKLDVLEHRPSGRLLAYDPATGETRVLLKDRYFANGVALGPDDAYLLLNETTAYRIVRYWLKGERAGRVEVFAENLPGFPDGVSHDEHGTFWVALYSPRNALLDFCADKPFLRQVVARLPHLLQPKPVRHAMVLGLDEDGDVVANLQAHDNPAFANITSVQAHQGYLYLGSLVETAYARLAYSR